MNRLLKVNKLRKAWAQVAPPEEELRYAFIANPPGTAIVQVASGKKVIGAYVAFGLVGAMIAKNTPNTKVTANARTESEHFPMASRVVVGVGSHRLRVWQATKKGKPETLTSDIGYAGIANVQLREIKTRGKGRRIDAGEVTVTMADKSRACFETDWQIAQAFCSMLLPVIGGLNAVREESLLQRRSVAQLQNRVAAMRATASSR